MAQPDIRDGGDGQDETTTIPLKKSTKKKLRKRGRKGDTWDEIVTKVLRRGPGQKSLLEYER